MMQRPILGLALAGFLLAPAADALSTGFSPVRSVTELSEEYDLTELSIEELMGIEVTVATRTEEPLSEVPAAVYVLTGDEIRRSGHTSVPEALRMVPGMYVSRWSSGAWDVTARGFGPGLSLTSLAYLNQLMVMIDGVTVYTPLFAGVWWPIQDIDMNNVDRIEVVRGPGGILWGSNAVHGVINIITKDSAETQGSRLDVQYGTRDRSATMTYGGKLSEDATYRVWVKGSDYDTLKNPWAGADYDWKIGQVGARFDWKAKEKQFAFWTRVYNAEFKNLGFDLATYDPIQVTDDKKGAMAHMSMIDPEVDSRWTAWVSTDQQDLETLLDSTINSFNIDYQRTLSGGERHDFTVGGGYRMVDSELVGPDPYWLAFDPANSTQHVFRAFGTDTIRFTESNTALTLGLVAEHNSFTDVEVQGTVRGTWRPHERAMFWSAVSRAVRTPSLEERNLSEDSYFVGNKQFKSETLIAYELGTRVIPAEWMSADLAIYYNDYDELHNRTWDSGNYQYLIDNSAVGSAYGAELALDFTLTDDWSVRSAYTYHHGDFETTQGDPLSTGDYHPRHAFNLRSYYDLGNQWEVDTGVYVIDGMGEGFEQADYVRLDARLGWRPKDGFNFYVGVQDFAQSSHSELDEYDNPERQFYVGLTLSH